MLFELICFTMLNDQLSSAGGRLIIASDGIWDALSSELAAKACRGLPAELSAKLVVKVMTCICNQPLFVYCQFLSGNTLVGIFF